MASAEEKLKKYANDMKSIDPSKFSFLLKEIPRIIKVRTRLGKGLLGDLSPLSEGYIKYRQSLLGGLTNKAHKNSSPSTNTDWLSGETTPNKSNLTLTGEMLNSIVGEQSGYRFTFTFSNQASNDKARWADEKGRPFFDLLPSELNGLQRQISAIMRDALRVVFKG